MRHVVDYTGFKHNEEVGFEPGPVHGAEASYDCLDLNALDVPGQSIAYTNREFPSEVGLDRDPRRTFSLFAPPLTCDDSFGFSLVCAISVVVLTSKGPTAAPRSRLGGQQLVTRFAVDACDSCRHDWSEVDQRKAAAPELIQNTISLVLLDIENN